jgi:hypothetical protein
MSGRRKAVPQKCLHVAPPRTIPLPHGDTRLANARRSRQTGCRHKRLIGQDLGRPTGIGSNPRSPARIKARRANELRRALLFLGCCLSGDPTISPPFPKDGGACVSWHPSAAGAGEKDILAQARGTRPGRVSRAAPRPASAPPRRPAKGEPAPRRARRDAPPGDPPGRYGWPACLSRRRMITATTAARAVNGMAAR